MFCSCEYVFFGGDSLAHFGEGEPGGHFVVGGVGEAFEVTAPGEAEAAGGDADLAVDGRGGEVGLAFEQADVPGGAKIVVGKSGAGVGDGD